jgi:hypothetical protein
MSAEFQTRDLPLFMNFGAKLQNYGFTHREFLPILDKYRSALDQFLMTMPPLPATGIAPSVPQAANPMTSPNNARPGQK